MSPPPNVIVLSDGADPAAVRRALIARGLWVERLEGLRPPQFLVGSHSAEIGASLDRDLAEVEGVAQIGRLASSHPLVDRAASGVAIVRGTIAIGPGQSPVVAAGPCSVESEAQIFEAAGRLAAAGVRILRGGAFKPRTSPYAFQGHGAQALTWMRRAADAHDLAVVTEALSPSDVPLVAEAADVIQIGSRNMHSAPLLAAAGRAGRPVLLKRGLAATVEEWLCAGETCLLHGAPSVIFCERGVRGFDPATRNLLDLGAVALLAGVRRLPVMVDPSHAAGRRDLIPALARAALACGASGLLLEVHDDPGHALSDGPQALRTEEVGRCLR
jgi:3-deoxy-7-phosphoheptulonate synthase